MKATAQYLHLYAEPEAALVADIPLPTLQHCLIIPAFDEQPHFFTRLTPLLNSQPLLIIIVINQPDTLDTATPLNKQLHTALQQQTQLQWCNQHLQLRSIANSPSYILLIDRFNQGPKIPAKKGVGLARKIATDIAALFIQQGKIISPWLHNTDCDTLLPIDYFQATTHNKAAALIYPFKHITNNDALGEATRLYEFSLHYYCAGLGYAKSPYAFHTVGSTLAPHVTAYCQARGFPQKSGGEDFYLLNKLAKIGPIESLHKPVIHIEARKSHRVPFGTGPAVETIMAMDNPTKDFSIYNPQVFEYLKQLLDLFPAFFQQNAEQALQKLPTKVQQVVLSMGIIKAAKQANKLSLKSNNQQQFLRHLNGWFDAFRTLKFIHGLRDKELPNIKAAELTSKQAPWITHITHAKVIQPSTNA